MINRENTFDDSNIIRDVKLKEAGFFFLLILILWLILLLVTDHKILEHSHYDQFTRQALMWQNGRISLPENIEYLELAYYNDKIYVSFPPAPTFIEFFLTIFFKEKTPNTLVLLLFTWISMILSFFILLKLTNNRWFSYFMSFTFFWGSNILYLSLEGAVWHQGQLYGLFFAIFAFFILFYANKKYYLFISGLLLGLSVGCRPFYIFLTPYFCYLAYKKFPSTTSILYFIIGLIPPGLFYSIYNYIRFDSIFEFGHKYLPWTSDLTHGIFSFNYLLRNLYHVFIKLPEYDTANGIISFHGMGVAVWIVSPIIILSIYYFFKKDIAIYERIFGLFSLILVWGTLLLHASNGWKQFGYRYSIDFVPLVIIFFGKSFNKNNLLITIISIYSIAINLYGAFWFYCLEKVM